MPRPTTTVNVNRSAAVYLIDVELHLRQAGRLLELQPDAERQRLAKVIFRLASRVRSDRLEAPA